MRHLLRAFLDFLDRRWPEKVTVTKKAYDQLALDVLAQGAQLSALGATVIELRATLNNLNIAMGYGSPKGGGLER